METTKFIALSGKMASGKSSVVNIIKEKYNTKQVKTVSIAYSLKKFCHDWYGMSLDEDKKDRDLLIKVANQMRSIDIDVFIKKAISEAKSLEGKCDIVCIDDLRFPNEPMLLKEAGFKLYRINCSEETRKHRLIKKYGVEGSRQHILKMRDPSEFQLDNFKKFDVILDGEKSLEQLKEELNLF